MTKVKICGITNLEDAMLSVRFGADALGFNFYPKSPRYIMPDAARVIVEQLPANILCVGVFVDETETSIRTVAVSAGIHALQLHGRETPEFVQEIKRRLGLPVIKAFRVSRAFDSAEVMRFEVDSVLLDAYSPDMNGGTGHTFDWQIAAKLRGIVPEMYLAGGLSPENVRLAIKEVGPYAVDACSSLEVSPGRKDPAKLRSFIYEAKRND